MGIGSFVPRLTCVPAHESKCTVMHEGLEYALLMATIYTYQD